MTPNRTERRRYFDPTPRAATAPSIIDRCQYVHRGSEAHRFMVANGFEELLSDESDGALMLPPDGWGEGSILPQQEGAT